MNPDTIELEPKGNLPKPKPKNGEVLIPQQHEAGKQQTEAQLQHSETTGAGAPPATAAPATTAIPAQAPPIAPASSPIKVHVTDSPSVAGDIDLIEKEWVVKAKAIVDKTRNDPHAQQKEISKFKADYMKKRYNKDVKVSEE